MSDSVKHYLNEIGLVPFSPLIGATCRRRSAARSARRGLDSTPASAARTCAAVTDAGVAGHRFIRANLRLVVSIARRYRPPSERSSLAWSRKETWVSSTPSTSSTGARASSSRPTGPCGSAKPWDGRHEGEPHPSARRRRPAPAPLYGRHPGDADQLDEANGRLHRLITPISLDRPSAPTLASTCPNWWRPTCPRRRACL